MRLRFTPASRIACWAFATSAFRWGAADPVATTKKSVSELFPRTSYILTSSAFDSSRERAITFASSIASMSALYHFFVFASRRGVISP